MTEIARLTGIVRGSMIEIVGPPPFAHGEPVPVEMVLTVTKTVSTGRPLAELAGCLSEFGESWDDFDLSYRRQRQTGDRIQPESESLDELHPDTQEDLRIE